MCVKSDGCCVDKTFNAATQTLIRVLAKRKFNFGLVPLLRTGLRERCTISGARCLAPPKLLYMYIFFFTCNFKGGGKMHVLHTPD